MSTFIYRCTDKHGAWLFVPFGAVESAPRGNATANGSALKKGQDAGPHGPYAGWPWGGLRAAYGFSRRPRDRPIHSAPPGDRRTADGCLLARGEQDTAGVPAGAAAFSGPGGPQNKTGAGPGPPLLLSNPWGFEVQPRRRYNRIWRRVLANPAAAYGVFSASSWPRRRLRAMKASKVAQATFRQQEQGAKGPAPALCALCAPAAPPETLEFLASHTIHPPTFSAPKPAHKTSGPLPMSGPPAYSIGNQQKYSSWFPLFKAAGARAPFGGRSGRGRSERNDLCRLGQWRKKRGGSPVSKGVEGSRFGGDAQRPLGTAWSRSAASGGRSEAEAREQGVEGSAGGDAQRPLRTARGQRPQRGPGAEPLAGRGAAPRATPSVTSCDTDPCTGGRSYPK